MLPYPYPDWKEKIKILSEFDGGVVIRCVFCNGGRRRPKFVKRARLPGTVDNPRTQADPWEFQSDTCKVCLGHGRLAVKKDTEEDPWVPCQQCETYGRILEEKEEYDGHTHCLVWEPCDKCKGLGFKLSSEIPYTGETTRLG